MIQAGPVTKKGEKMMDKLEKFWRDAPAGYLVCAETGVTKNMILNAIVDGAKDIDAISKMLPLCRSRVCASKNPSGVGCSENTEVILSIYAPIYEFMKEGHSHGNESGPDCGGKSSGSCGSCKLCQ